METEAVWRTARAPERARGHACPEPEAYPDAARPRIRLARAVPAAWNGADADYPRHATLHSLVEAQVRRTPSAPALHFAGETVSYAEMDARASRIAARLRALGVGPERRVALCVERGPAQIVALLGILKAGGAYVPIDPAAPAERRDSLVADVGATALVADPPVEAAVPVVSPDGEGKAAATECGTGPDSLAYVLYTSGSTGKPKGVLGTHRGMVNLVHWQARAFGAGPGDRVLQWAPLSFDAASAEIFMALTSGAALVLATREQLIPGRELVEILRAHRITHAKFTPTALAALPPAHLPDLRVVATGGEACTADLVRRWGAGRRFFNVYGPTECSVRAAAGEMRPGGAAPTVGRPLPNARVHVVGADGLPTDAGVEGELCIGGIGVARGYLGHPALTARAFVPDAFSGRPGARLYRSGDRARWTPAGELEFLGRLDDQVKIRGFRVEPGEVTAALRAVPGVREAAVVARADGEVRLVAYFAGDETLTPATLRAALERRLLDHMVPSAFVRVAAIPLTAHGKVDRRALPDPEEGGEGGPPLEAILQAALVSVDEPPFVPVHRLAPRTESRADDADVDARANRLARRLIRLTGGAGERIAVALPSPEHLAVAVLGVLKAGAVCIIPDENDVLRDAALVVTARAVAAALHLPTAVLCLDADAELLSREPSSPPYVGVDADATALVVSGVAISHALLSAVVKLDRAMLRGVPVLARLAWAVDGRAG